MNIFKNIISFILTTFIVFCGSVCLTYYVSQSISLGSAFAGIVGIILMFPAFTTWENRINKLLKNED
jgi:hypothetical protein